MTCNTFPQILGNHTLGSGVLVSMAREAAFRDNHHVAALGVEHKHGVFLNIQLVSPKGGVVFGLLPLRCLFTTSIPSA